MLSQDQSSTVELILEELPAQTSMEVVRNFLKACEVESSAVSWEEIKEKRIRPALEDGRISYSEFLSFARDVEEHGTQHVFLYDVADKKKIQHLFDEEELKKRLLRVPNWPALNKISVAEQVSQKSVVEVRLYKKGRQKEFVVKIAEPRLYRRRKGEERHGNEIVVKYAAIEYRAVNIFRVNSSGAAEIRVFSHKQSRASYEQDVFSVWQALSPIVSGGHFVPHSLLDLRQALWHETLREQLAGEVHVRNSQLQNINGNRLRVAAGQKQGGLWDDQGLVDGVGHFSNGLEAPDCEFASVMLIANGNGTGVTRDLGFTLNGQANEFILPHEIDGREYEAIIKFVRKEVS